MKTCEDCFEDFEPRHKDQTICEGCKPFYGKEDCVQAWKIFHSRGFNTQFEIDEYQNIKVLYKNYTGKKLPKIDEKLNRRNK